MSRPWFAIVWFAIWGLFQAYAVASILTGRWHKPEAFPQDAYVSLIYPDMFFIPIYLLTSALLLRRHWLGGVLAFVAGGGIIYVMVYLLALSRLSGSANLIADGSFLACTVASLWQVGYRCRAGGQSPCPMRSCRPRMPVAHQRRRPIGRRGH
jgi:hypothetical protein